MGWSPEFVDWLSSPVLEPAYLLESVVVGTFEVTSTPLKYSSFELTGYTHALTREGSGIDYGELTPGSWDRSYASLRIGLLPLFDPRAFITRGQVLQLRVGRLGWDISQFQTVFLGSVRNVHYRSGRWSIELVELAGALQNRFDSAADQQNLFYTLGRTTLAADFDPDLDTEIELTNAGTAGVAKETGGEYVVRITPSSGDPFYVSAATLSTNTLQTLTNDRFNTTSVAALTGDTVEGIAYIEGHPCDVVNRILVSTGSVGQNSPADLLPAGWAYAIPKGLVADDDIAAFKSYTEPTLDWDVKVDNGQPNALQWLHELLKPGGFFLSTHQGQLTCRAVLHDVGLNTPGTISITDDDIVDIVSYETWDSASPVEYRNSRVLGALGTDGAVYVYEETSIASRPTRARYRRDLAHVYANSDDDWTEEVGDRLGPYDTRVPERITLELAGWRAAVASMGDLVAITTQFLTSRDSADPELSGRKVLVIGGGCDWFGSSVTLTLLLVPGSRGRE